MVWKVLLAGLVGAVLWRLLRGGAQAAMQDGRADNAQKTDKTALKKCPKCGVYIPAGQSCDCEK